MADTEQTAKVVLAALTAVDVFFAVLNAFDGNKIATAVCLAGAVFLGFLTLDVILRQRL